MILKIYAICLALAPGIPNNSWRESSKIDIVLQALEDNEVNGVDGE